MKQEIHAFLPCRRGSERVKNKNTKNFAGIEGGLTYIKLQQLVKCPDIDTIIVSTDDEKVADISLKVKQDTGKPIKIFERPAHLATSITSTDDLIKYVPEIIPDGEILWTHVTSPFVGHEIYTRAINIYHQIRHSDTHDSLMSVTKIQKFIWDSNKPINYDRSCEKWPRTQTMKNLYEINSAIFIASHDVYLKQQDRIGERVYLFEITPNQAIDVDWQEDFILAERYWKNV